MNIFLQKVGCFYGCFVVSVCWFWWLFLIFFDRLWSFYDRLWLFVVVRGCSFFIYVCLLLFVGTCDRFHARRACFCAVFVAVAVCCWCYCLLLLFVYISASTTPNFLSSLSVLFPRGKTRIIKRNAKIPLVFPKKTLQKIPLKNKKIWKNSWQI